jgi:hypothetical protein
MSQKKRDKKEHRKEMREQRLKEKIKKKNDSSKKVEIDQLSFPPEYNY